MSNLICIFLSQIILLFSFLIYNKEVEFFDIIKLEESSGARCLDGSPYTFFFKKGSGDGLNNFILFFDGGGWCSKKVYNSTLESCWKRTLTYLGSSEKTFTQKIFNLIGKYPFLKRWGYMLSSDEINNSIFHNWNKVFINYCDGRGFVGFNDEPILYNNKHLYFRGFNNTMGILNYLKDTMKFKNSKNVIISGVSAGGTASLVYSNFIADYLPNTKVRTVSDSGFFLDFENKMNPNYNFSVVWKDLITDTNPKFEPLLTTYCTREDQWKCFLPEYFYDHIRVPVFILHSQYDIYAICNLIGSNCRLSFTSYNVHEHLDINEHREKFVNIIQDIKKMKNDWGTWSPACYLHDFVMYSFFWKKKIINNTSLNEAINNWYLQKNEENFYADKNQWPNNEKCAYSRDLFYYMEYFKINTDIY